MEGTQQASWALGQPAALVLVLLLVGGGRRRRRQRARDIWGSSRRGSEALERAAEWRRCGSRALVGVDRRPHTRNGAGTRSPRAPKIVGRIGLPVRAGQQGKLRRLLCGSLLQSRRVAGATDVCMHVAQVTKLYWTGQTAHRRKAKN